MIRARPTMLFTRARTPAVVTQIPALINVIAAAGRRSISSRRMLVGPALAMDPASSEEIIIDNPFFRIYADRRIDRLIGTTIVPPGFDPATGVTEESVGERSERTASAERVQEIVATDALVVAVVRVICDPKDARVRYIRLPLHKELTRSTVTSKDVTIDADTGLYVRLYLPDTSKQNDNKLPLLVYFHGGAFVIQSAAAPAYQPFLSTLAARAGLLVVSVNFRLAPEHPFPIGYEDCLRALEWAVAGGGGDPWLSRHGDLGRVFLAGESTGGNIAHNVAMMAAEGAAAAALEGAVLLHPGFSGREPLDGELLTWKETMGKLWAVVCPEAADGTDDPRMNPAAVPTSLRRMPCRRVLVCAAGEDYATPRCRAYYEALAASGWGGEVEWFESKGEYHVFFLAKPADDDVVVELMNRLVTFFTATAGN